MSPISRALDAHDDPQIPLLTHLPAQLRARCLFFPFLRPWVEPGLPTCTAAVIPEQAWTPPPGPGCLSCEMGTRVSNIATRARPRLLGTGASGLRDEQGGLLRPQCLSLPVSSTSSVPSTVPEFSLCQRNWFLRVFQIQRGMCGRVVTLTLTVKQPIRLCSKGRWKARGSPHQSKSSVAALWKLAGFWRCCGQKAALGGKGSAAPSSMVGFWGQGHSRHRTDRRDDFCA